MDIPLPPTDPKPTKVEYSPSQVTSPHSDDDDNYKMSKESSPFYSSSSSSSKKVLSKKKVSNMLKSMKMTIPAPIIIGKKSKLITSAVSSESLTKEDDENSYSPTPDRDEKEDLRERQAIMQISNNSKADRYKEKLKEREREKEQKLNIEALIEEEKNEKKVMPKLDLMPNKAGSSYQRTRNAVGPIEMDEINRQRAEERAMKMAADMASAKKGAVVCDSFGFVTAVRPIVHITPAKPEESKRDRDRSRDRSRNRDRDRDRDKGRSEKRRSRSRSRDRKRRSTKEKRERSDGDKSKSDDKTKPDDKNKPDDKSKPDDKTKAEKSTKQKRDRSADEKEEKEKMRKKKDKSDKIAALVIKEKYNLKEGMPKNWLQLKAKGITINDSSDFVTLKKAFNEPLEDPNNLIQMITLTQGDIDEIRDPTSKECEDEFHKRGQDKKIKLGLGGILINDDYKTLEFPKLALEKTETTPALDWCMNKDYCMAELYKYRADIPEVIDTIKDLKKAKFEGKNTNLQEQYWYIKENEFMKAAKKPKEVTKKREKVKKSALPIDPPPSSAVQEHNETLNAKDLIKLLKNDLGEEESTSGKVKNKKEKKAKKKKKKKDIEDDENLQHFEEQEEDQGKIKKKKKKSVKEKKKKSSKKSKSAAEFEHDDVSDEENEIKSPTDASDTGSGRGHTGSGRGHTGNDASDTGSGRGHTGSGRGHTGNDAPDANLSTSGIDKPINSKLDSKLMSIAGYNGDDDPGYRQSPRMSLSSETDQRDHRKRKREDPRSPSPLAPAPKKSSKRPRTPPPADRRSISPPTDPRLRRGPPSGPRTPSPRARGTTGPRTPPGTQSPRYRSRSRSPVYKGRTSPSSSSRSSSKRTSRGRTPPSPRRIRSPSPGGRGPRRGRGAHSPPHSPHYSRSRFGGQDRDHGHHQFRLERSVADSTISDADLISRSGHSTGPLDISVPPPALFGLSETSDLQRQSNSPKRPSLDERLEKELGIKVRNESVNGIPDFSKPPPGFLPHGMPVMEPTPPAPEAENNRLVRVGNMLQIVPEAAKITSPQQNIVPAPALRSPALRSPAMRSPALVPAPIKQLGLQVLTPEKLNKQTPTPTKLNEEESKATELMKKLEEQKKRKEAERRQRREQRLADLQKKEIEENRPQAPQPPKQSGSSGRILESLEREEDKEARILAEAMTSVPDDEDEDHDQIEEEEDIQSFSAAERRSKSKQRKNATDVRYISLKPFFKKERKRQQQKSHFEAESAEIESNGAAPDDLDNMDDDNEEYIKASPVPLPDASTCKSILHRFGYNNETARDPHKKNLRYADGVLPGSGSPDHHSTATQEVSPPPSVGNRKRRKKIQVRIIETRHAADSSSDSDEDRDLPPPPPPGSPKLYQTAEFVAKFACKAELKVAS